MPLSTSGIHSSQSLPRPQRQGQHVGHLIPKGLPQNAERPLRLAMEWCEANSIPLTKANVHKAAEVLKSSVEATDKQVMQTLSSHLNIDPTNAHIDSLEKALSKQVKGSPKMNNLLKWLLMAEYVPSTLVMLYVTKNIYNEMEDHHKITPNENQLLYRQELARQGVGTLLHVFRTFAGFGAVAGLTALLKKHQAVRNVATRIEAPSGLRQKAGEALHSTANTMQHGWNTLYSDANQTIASIVSLMVINVATYGLTRPLLINAAFWGINPGHPHGKDAHLTRKEANEKEKLHPHPVNIQTDYLGIQEILHQNLKTKTTF